MNETNGFAVIGAGIIGTLHVQAYSRHPHVYLKAVCDLDAARAGELAETYGVPEVVTDYREILADPDVTAVSIATPDFAHHEIAVAAARAGKHVLVEKPLAMTVAESEEIVRAARRAGVKLMVNFQNRFNPPFLRARQRIIEGELGAAHYIYARLNNTTFVPTKMLSWSSRTSPLWFLASHTLDLCRWMLRDEPSKVYAVKRSGLVSGRKADADDFHLAVVEFSSGTVVTLENTWILPETEPVVYNLKFEILGSRGSIYVNTSDHRAMEAYLADKSELPDLLGVFPTGEGRSGGFMLEAIRRFADAVVHDLPSPVPGEEGLLTTKGLVAIAESAETGKPVLLT